MTKVLIINLWFDHPGSMTGIKVQVLMTLKLQDNNERKSMRHNIRNKYTGSIMYASNFNILNIFIIFQVLDQTISVGLDALSNQKKCHLGFDWSECNIK